MKIFSKILLLLLCILLLICSTGCLTYRFSGRVSSTFACYAIPGGYATDPHLFREKVIETDEYGRALYDIRVDTVYGIRAFCIYQKVEEEYLYYYDNVCYRCFDRGAEYDEALLEQIKTENDWGKPLDLSKCVKKQLNAEEDLYPVVAHIHFAQLKNIETYIEKAYPAETAKYRVTVETCDKSANGLELYLICVGEVLERNQRNWIEHYLVVVHEDGSYDPDNYIIKFNDLQKSNEPLAEIKERNGWIPTT